MKLLSKLKIDTEQFFHIVIFLLCFLPIISSFLLATDGGKTTLRILGFELGIGVPCFFKTATHYNCPGCGMTRCFIYMSHFQLKMAWTMSRAGVLLYIFCIMQSFHRALQIFRVTIPFIKQIIWFEAIFLVSIGILDLWDFAFQFFRNG